MQSRRSRWVVGMVGLLLALLVALAIALAIASRKVEGIAKEWLGDNGTAATIDVGWHSVRMTDVKIKAPEGWPGQDALIAGTVMLEPRWTALLSDRIDIARILIQDYEIQVLRPAKGGIDVLPSLREHAKAKKNRTHARAKRVTIIESLAFERGTVHFYDAQISRKPLHIPIDRFSANIGPLRFPLDETRTNVDMSGDIRGVGGTDGKFMTKGWLEVATRDAQIQTRMSAVPIARVAPYLQRGSPLGFSGGFVGLDLDTKVERKQIDAHGTLRLSHLTLSDDGLAALPRKAALAAIADNDGRATFAFTLSGSLSKPVFKMDENLSMRIAGGLAGVLGISIEGLADGIGNTVEGVGSALSNLMGSGEN